MLKIVKSRRNLKSVNSRLQARKTASTDVKMRIILKDEEPVCQPSSTSFHRKTRSKQTDRRTAQRKYYMSEFFGICKSNRIGKKGKMDLRECALTTEN
ncbi:hypothetical protein TNCV_125351 [Trichonephila clavipes]|nr:hypothetical protein TNCV_125351 [Trichonephila clavipes]